MSLGQPDVQWHHTRLGPKADQSEHEESGARGARQTAGCRAKRDKVEAVPTLRQGEEDHQQRSRSRVRHDQIKQAGARVLLAARIAHHQNVARQGHALPGEQEGEAIARAAHSRHAGDEHGQREGLHQRGLRVRTQVRRPIQGSGRGDQSHHQKEERREAIQRKRHLGKGEQPRQRQVQGSLAPDEHAQRESRARGCAGQDQQVP